MKDNDIFWVEVDDNGNPTDFVLLDGNYKNAKGTKALENKTMVQIQNNLPELNNNQYKQYSGFSKKESGEISKDWDVITMSSEECIDLWIRGPRNLMLADCDWTQMPDAPLSESDKLAWFNYRQELRDMTSPFNEENPLVDRSQVIWPNVPGVVAEEDA